MATRLYKVYPSSQYDSLDLNLFTSNIRWNLSGNEFIVEFIEPPHGNTSVLSLSEAQQLMQTEDWFVQAEDLLD